MDPNPNHHPILTYVMDKLPSIKHRFTAEQQQQPHDVENPVSPPKSTEPVFELSEKMPHLKNPNLLSSMRSAVSDVSQTRSILQTLGTRPDHETVDAARLRIAEIDDAGAETLDNEKLEDYKVYKAVIALEEMFESYEKMLSEAEKRLERIYEAAVNGEEEVEVDLKGKGVLVEEEAVNEDVVRILEEAEAGKEVKRVDLDGKGLKIFPEVFGKFRSFVVLNLANNQLQVIPDSVAGLINLEELYLSENLLEALPDSIGLLFKLKILDVSRNRLAALPDSICQCRSLVELDASFNKLTYLPTNIGFELVNLQKLSIHLNKIRSLPSSIGDLKSLRILDVHFNELNGLPHSIGKLTNLEILNLGSNFSDLKELPETISDLTSLKELDLSNNQIHALPDNFGRLVSLNKLNLDENPLTIPPKNVLTEGVEAVRAYMVKRLADIEMEEERKNGLEVNDQAQAGFLSRSTSWLSNVVSGYIGGAGKSNDDSYLNQQL